MTGTLVSYMLRQGYKADQIVVLTPYLGQLLEIHKELKGSNQEVIISTLISMLRGPSLHLH